MRKFLTFGLLTSVCLFADVSGKVFQDLPITRDTINTYGYNDGNEPGVKGITVRIFPDNISTVTDENGDWKIETNSPIVQITYENIPSYLYQSYTRVYNNRLLRTVPNGSEDIPLALHVPSNWIGPSISMGMVFNSTSDTPSQILLSNIPADNVFDSNGLESDEIPLVGDVKSLISKTGNIWGLTYHPINKVFYASSALRRHTDISPDGLGSIYMTTLDGDTTLFTSIPNVGVVESNRELEHDQVFDEVGRMGLGDLDISSDYNYLYTINQNTKKFLKVNISDKSIQEVSIGEVIPGCSDINSWGISEHNNEIYIGSVCSNDITKGAAISKLVNNSFEPIHTINLDYDGEISHWNNPGSKRWYNWATEGSTIFNSSEFTYPTPILSDIVFDEFGNINIAFIDRTSFQAGNKSFSTDLNDSTEYTYYASGDIVHVCLKNGSYFNEGTAECPQKEAPLIDSIPSQQYPEYFDGDDYGDPYTRYYLETGSGSLAYLFGSGKVAMSSYNPLNVYDFSVDPTKTSGVKWLDTESGDNIAGIILNKGSFAHAGSLGGISYLREPAPTEIGDFVWFDENSNGHQDFNETGIKDIFIELLCNGMNYRAKSDHDGYFLFSNDTSENSNDSQIYGVNFNECSLFIDLTQEQLNELTPTTKGVGLSLSDSNFEKNGTLILPILEPGKNRYDLDVGFAPKEYVSIGSYIWEDLNGDSLQDANESGIANVPVKLFNKSGTLIKQTITDINGTYIFDRLDEGNYSISVKPDGNFSECELQTPLDNQVLGDSNIRLITNNEYRSPLIDLKFGEEPLESNNTGDNLDPVDANGDMTIDFCFYRTPSIDVELSTNGKDADHEDNASVVLNEERVVLSYLVVNDGDVKLDNIRFDLNLTCPKNSLDVGEKMICSDVEFNASIGLHKNSVKAFGDPDNGANVVNDYDQSFYLGLGNPNITLDKKTNGVDSDIESEAIKILNGEPVVWSYIVTNNGEVNLTNIRLDDDKEGLISCPKTTLAVNEEMNCSISGLASIGLYKNEAIVIGTPTNGLDDVNSSDFSFYLGLGNPSIVIEKSTNGEDADSQEEAVELLKGDSVRWSYYVKNDGEVALNNISVLDDKEGSVSCPKTTLLSGEEMFCSDKSGIAETGLYKNLGSVTGSPDNGLANITDSDFSHYLAKAIPSIKVVKLTNNTATRDNPLEVFNGDAITWSYSILNDGEVTLNNISGLDDKEGDLTCPKDSLSPNEEMVCQDKNGVAMNGFYINVVNVYGTPTNGLPVVSDDDIGQYVSSKKSIIGNDVWLDENNNNFRDPNEIGIDDINVSLLDRECKNIITSQKTVNGKYLFTELDSGDYCVSITVPIAYKTDDKTKVELHLGNSEDNLSVDFGLQNNYSSIGDKAWLDANINGIQDEGEVGLSSVKVSLYKHDCKTLIETTETNSSGMYSFDKLLANNYCLKFNSLSGYGFTEPNVGSDKTIDSEREITPISLGYGEDANSFDIGYYKLLSLGDLIWDDSNEDKIKNQGELGLPNIEVSLYESDCQSLVQSTKTDSSGNYLFKNLVKGNYCVLLDDIPSNYNFPLGLIRAVELNSSKFDYDVGLIKKEIEVTVLAKDDTLDQNVTDVTTIDVLSNDSGDFVPASIRFVISTNVTQLWVSGETVNSPIQLTKKVSIRGQGEWVINDDLTISFIRESGFEGDPDSVYYVTHDINGNFGNIAKVSIKTFCEDDGFQSDSAPSVNLFGILLILLAVGLFGQREEIKNV